MQLKIMHLEEMAKSIGLNISQNKSKVMRVIGNENQKIKLFTGEVEEVK